MNDRELLAGFRALDVPVTPDPAFADALFADLRATSLARSTRRLALLLVAAALLLLATGLAIAGGSPNRLQDEVLPSPSAPTYAVSIPDGAQPVSRPLAVEAAIRAAQGVVVDLRNGRRIERMEWVAANTEFTTPSGSGFSSGSPFWAVLLVPDGTAPLATDGPTRMLLYVSDGTLSVIGSDSADAAEAAPTFAPVPSLGPEPLLLVTPGGASIEPDVIPIAGAELRPVVNRFAFHGDAIWALVQSSDGGGEPYLVRIDPDTLEQRRVPVTDGRLPSVFVPGTPPEPTPLPDTGAETPLGLDAHGLWVGEAYGIRLVDPVTGKTIRSIPTLEGEGHAYRRFWEPPAYGSLWDSDRGARVFRRVDPVTGATQKEIPMPGDIDHERCGDPAPLRGISGLPDLVAAHCGEVVALLDPATNRFLRTVPATEMPDVVAAGAWLAGDNPGYGRDADPWEEPGSLVRLDPEGGATTPVFTLNQPRTGVLTPVVSGDALWFLAAVRPGAENPYVQAPRLVRVPLAPLGLEEPSP